MNNQQTTGSLTVSKDKSEQAGSKAREMEMVIGDDHDYLAYFLQALACIIWTSSYLYTNQHNFNVFQVNIAKGVVGTLLNYLVMTLRRKIIPFEQPHNFKWLLILNVCILAYFYGLPLSQLYLPLPIVHTIGCSSIAIIYIIDYFLNGTRITRHGAIGITCALVGVIFMANNRLILHIAGHDEETTGHGYNYRESSAMFGSFIALVLLVSRILNCYALVKFKSFPNISVFELNYHNNIVGTFTGAIGYMLTSTHVSMPIFWPSFLTMGLGQFVCMSLFFYSFKITKKTGNVMVINALNIVVAFLISYFRYGEGLNAILIAGAGCIITGMLIIIWETMKSKAAREKGPVGEKQ